MKTYRIAVLVLQLVIITQVFSQYPNTRIFPSSNVQIEPSISRNPANPQLLFAAAYTLVGASQSVGVYVSTNGGLNWTGTDQCPGALVSGDPGPIIDKNGVLILTHQGFVPPGMFCNTSTNSGGTWSTNTLIAANNQEKGSPISDEISSSPFYGRTYLAWTRSTSPFPIVLSYTANSGANWTAFQQINSSQAGHQSLGAVMAVGPQGQVYLSWASCITSAPLTEDGIGFAVSTNGGANWSVQEAAYDCNGIKTSQFGPWNIRMNGYPEMDVDLSGGARNGWIYIVTAEKNLAPAGSDADVVFHKSTDGGASWSAGIRVNQDPINNGKVQFFPIMSVDQNGGINVVYYDNRNSASGDSVEMYLSRSIDGGNIWNDYKISDHKFKPKTASGFGPGLWGDNIGMTTANNKLFPVWMDDYNSNAGVYQVWTAIIDLTTIGVQQVGTEIPKSFSLKQNFPNPFNPETRILFSVPKESSVQLTIYDALGREIEKLVQEKLNPGSYSVSWIASTHPSGVYYYELKTDSYTETKKMVLVK
jgi:hypothetical protein